MDIDVSVDSMLGKFEVASGGGGGYKTRLKGS